MMSNIVTNEQLVSSLLDRNGPVDIQCLAGIYDCSKKTITRRLKDITESYLRDYQVKLEGDASGGYILRGKDLNRLRENVEVQTKLTLWRSQTERQLLILLELFSSHDYFSKLYILANKFHITEATVLNDIRSLNQKYPSLQINSSPGVGTQLIGSDLVLRSGILSICYGLLEPSNFLYLVAIGHSLPLARSCASNCYFKFIESKIDISQIISSINRFEVEYHLVLSDLAFANFFLFLTLRNIQNNGISDGSITSDDLCFSIGLEQSVLQKILPDYLVKKEWEEFSASIRKVIESDLDISWFDFWSAVQPKFALAKYRNELVEKYWEDKPKEQRLYKSSTIERMDHFCSKFEIRDWLHLDSLLGIVGGYLKCVDNRIEVALVCVTGTGTALIFQEMIERFCPKIRVSNVFSLREYLKSNRTNQIVISTIQTGILPDNTVYIDSMIDKNDWIKIQDNILGKDQ